MNNTVEKNSQNEARGTFPQVVNMQQRPQQQVMEIDLLELLRTYLKYWWMIVVAALCCGVIGYSYSRFMITPTFESTSVMFILSKETTLTSLADLQIGSQLTQDYKEVVTSRPVLQDVIAKQQLNVDYKRLKSNISIANPSNTRILKITVKDTDPARAKAVADCVAETAAEYIADIMEMIPPKIIETGEIPEKKSAPSNGKNAAMAALIGAVLVMGMLTVNMLLDDSIKDEEDVKKYLGLSVLASIPLREGTEQEKKEIKKKTAKMHKESRRTV